MDIVSKINSLPLYLIVAFVLLSVCILAGIFLYKSYKAGKEIGMDEKLLKRTMTSSATFTVLPSISILLGVIALAGALGIPLAWLRLSVVGSLQYELNVAEITANAMGLSGLNIAEIDAQTYTTIALVMTVAILGGILLCIFFGKKYLNKIKDNRNKNHDEENKKTSFGAYATIAMFIGLCSAYFASYIGEAIHFKTFLPLAVAFISGVCMLFFEYLVEKKNIKWLDNFSMATSMIIGMIAAIFLNGIL